VAGSEAPQPSAPAEPLDGPTMDGEAERELVEGRFADDSAEAVTAFVDGALKGMLRAGRLPAMTVAVVRDDALLMARGYGLADVATARPVEPERTLFRIGSVSKTFTWTAVMMLAERGLVDLDRDVNEYLRHVEVAAAFGEPVTLRHLMSHRAGFEDTVQLFAVADDDPRTLSELLAAHQPRRVFAPGTRTSYSNWGAALAAQIVEDVTGERYGDWLERAVLDPLGMHDTTWISPFFMDEPLRERLANGYQRKHGALAWQRYMQIGAYWPAGGIASTATDMARWMRFHLNGGELDGVHLLGADTHAAMWTRAYGDRANGADVAHGFQDRWHNGVRLLGHGGGTAAFLTNMILVPELGLGVFVSQNSTHAADPIRLLAEMIVDHVQGTPYVPMLVDPDAEGGDAVRELAGSYVNNRRIFSTFMAIAGLQFARVTPVDGFGFVFGGGGQEGYYRQLADDTDVFEASTGDRIAVVRDGRGRVVALADGSGVHTLERANIRTHPATFFVMLGLALLFAVTRLSGAWRRFGRGTAAGFASRIASGIGLGAAVAVLIFVGSAIFLVVQFVDFDMAEMPRRYPVPAMFYVHYAGWLVAAAAIALLFGLWPAWTQAHWGILRRVHYTLFAGVMVLLMLLLWQWRVIGAAVV
jgi:CubicO group peptidase (beta-lactamase class C family)